MECGIHCNCGYLAFALIVCNGSHTFALITFNCFRGLFEFILATCVFEFSSRIDSLAFVVYFVISTVILLVVVAVIRQTQILFGTTVQCRIVNRPYGQFCITRTRYNMCVINPYCIENPILMCTPSLFVFLSFFCRHFIRLYFM